MESKKKMDRSVSSNETKIDDFAAERELIEEKHRMEVLNLLKSFEFERKDNEARFLAAQEQKDGEAKLIQHGDQQEGFSKDGGDMNGKQEKEGDELLKKFEKEKDNLMSKKEELEAKLIQRGEQQDYFHKDDADVNEKQEDERDELLKKFEKEKENLMSKIEELEKEALSKRHVEDEEGDEEYQSVSPDFAVSEATSEDPNVTVARLSQAAVGPNESEANASVTPHTTMEKEEWLTENQIPKRANNYLKSLTELEKENLDLKEELDCQRKEVNELGNQVAHLNQKLDNIREVFEDEDALAADKNQRIHEILEDCSRKSSGSAFAKNDSFDESSPNRGQISHPQRSNSEMSFQLEELNVENEELQNNVLEIERKFRRTVEEYEIQRSVFQDKINVVLERLIEAQQSDQGEHSSELVNGISGDVLKNIINELRNVELKKSSVEFLEDYVGIVLRWNSDSNSPDASDVNLRREIQTLEQLLDIEIFDGRAFDNEMKDEVKQVLRDKEKELMVAHAVENLRTEIRHRVATESTLEELRKERENHFSVYHAARQILREHLGISGTAGDTKELEKVLAGYSQVQPEDAEEKLEEELTNSADVDALKEEKEGLEQALRELQSRFEKEQQEWLNKLGSESQEEDAEKDNHKDKVIENLRARIAAMEEVLNTERFYLSRLYYVEMKEELDASLKMYHSQHSGKQETERLTDAWKHHVEVGELYQKILDKETEAIERINLKQSHVNETEPGNSLPQPENSDLPEAPLVGTLSEEMLRLDTQLPIMLELVELQRKRCREHKAVTLILEQAVNAVETAVQGHDSLLVSGDFLHRKSSWESNEESGDNGATPEISSLSPRISGALERGTGQNVNEADLYGDSINSKEALQRALEIMLEKLLNEETERKNLVLGSGSSDSDVSELETSSGKEIPSDDETGVNESDYETGQGSLSEIETQMDGEAENYSEDLNNTSELAVPIIYELPPNIEEVLRIETFNMSRLLRDEYIDTIRRERGKTRRIQAENNAELLAKFQERVGLLLEGIDFGETGEEREEKDHSRKRQKLSATPSHDSGIQRDLDTDKDDVVRKYKELLEKARENLNRAHRALKERPRKMDGDEINNEIVQMKRNMKEKENDLKELKEKYSALENERKALLSKIKKMDPSHGLDTNSRTELPGEENGEATKVEHVTHTDQLSPERQGSGNERERTLAPGAGDESEINPAFTGVRQKQEDENDMDGGDSAGRSLGIKAESDGIEGDREVSQENEALKEKVEALEKEIESKEMECKEKQEEVNELQRKLLDGTGGDDIIRDLQEKLNDAREEGKKLKVRCSELEKGKELGRSYKEDDPNRTKELERFKTENETLENENKLKQEKINDLQVKLLAGTDGEQILKDLQQDMDELSKKNKMLEKCQEKERSSLEKEPLSEDHMADTVARLKRENETLGLENQDVSAKVEKLQKDLLEGTGSEELLQELQNEVKGLRATNNELEKKCRNIEENKIASAESGDKVRGKWQKELNQMNKEKEKLILDNKSKEKEIDELQKKLLEGSGGEELLDNLQEQMRELKEKEEGLEKHCQELEDTCEELKNEKEYDRILKKELSDTREENVGLLKENKSKDAEVRELQNALVKGSGSEEILQTLHDKIKEAEVNNKLLEKQCNDLKDSSEELEKKEIESTKENRKLNKEVERIKKENDYLARESQAKGDEISKLQEKLLDGTGGEEILPQLRDQVKELEEKNKELKKKCNKMEDREEILNEEGRANKENEKELGRLKNQNERLLQDSKSKEKEISKLQKKLLEGSGGEDILEKLQDTIKETEENNKVLGKERRDLKNVREGLRKKDDALASENRKLAKEVEQIKKENDYLGRESQAKGDEISKLQEKLLNGTGGEEILPQLRDQVKELEEKNKELKKKCNKMEDREEILNEEGRVNKENEKELGRLKNQNERLLQDSKSKEKEISKLQKKLLEGSGGEDLLENIQNQLKELMEKNEQVEADCNKLEDENERLRDDKDTMAEENNEITRVMEEKSKLADENKTKDDEIRELQRKLVLGTGGEEILEKLQDKIKETEQNNKVLGKECRDLKNVREGLRKKDDALASENRKLAKEVEQIKKENDYLERESQAKGDEISKLQERLLDGTGGEGILTQLRDQVKELEEKNKELRKKCNKMEDREEILNEEGRVNKENEKELGRLKNQNERLLQDSKSKEKEISELQKKLLEGSGGEAVLENIQNQLKELREKIEQLEADCNKLGDENERLKEDNGVMAEENNEITRVRDENSKLADENKTKDDEIRELQRKLVLGTGGEEILEKLQDKIKETEENNKALGKECRDLKNVSEGLRKKDNGLASENKKLAKEVEQIKNANNYLERESLEKCDEVSKLQEKLLDGTGSEEILPQLRDQVKELEEKNKELKKKCNKMEDREEMLNEEVRNNKENEKELGRLKNQNERLLQDSKNKEKYISKLQKKLLEGSGGEDILENIQNQLKELKEKNEQVEADCCKLEDENERLREDKSAMDEENNEITRVMEENSKLADENKTKDDEIRELQRKLVLGTGGEEILEKLQDKIKETEENNKALGKECRDLKNARERLRKKDNALASENRKLAKEVEQIKNANDYLECESLEKSDEVSKLQEKLLDGTGGEEILPQLRDQVKELEEKNKELKKKCNKMEDREEILNEEVRNNKENEKELGRLKNQNERLLQDSKSKEKEISKLQNKLLEGSGGEGILENIQNQLKERMEKNEQLEADCCKLEDENERLREDKSARDEETNEITRVMEENSNLADENKTKDDEIRELERKLVLGTGGEEILEKLQDKIKETEENNKALGKECRDLKNVSEGLRKKDNGLASENKKLAKEVEQIKNANNYLERESLEKSDEVSKLQEKLLDGTGGEEILPQLRDQVKELEEKNKELKKKCNKMEDREEILNEEVRNNKENEKELGRLKNQNERLLQDSKSKKREISELQKKLLEGSGGEDILENIQNQLKELMAKNEQLEADCYKLEDENETLREDKGTMADQAKELEAKNKELKKKCNEMEDRVEMLNDDDEGQINKENKEELAEIKMKMKRISLENKEKDDEIVELQKKLLDGSGADDILEKLQKQIKNLKKENENLRAVCRNMKDVNRSLKEGGDKRLDKMDDISRLREENKKLTVENETKACEISDLQAKLISGTGGEDILQQLQGDLKVAKEMNNELEKKCKDMETSQDGLINKDGKYKKTDVSGYLNGRNPAKSKEVNGMQKSSRKRTRRDEIVPEFQERLNGVEDANELLEERRESARQLDKLKSENETLLVENKGMAEEISELQQKLFEGTGQGDILQKLQDEIKQLREKGETLKSDCHGLEDENEKLRNDRIRLQDELNETPKLRKEKEVLVAENEDKCNEVCELQRRLIEGTGVEEVVQQLQDDLKNLKEKNKQYDNTSKLINKDDQTLKREIAQMEYINGQLESENETKSEEINRLQKKLVEGNGSEDILGELQDQVKELEKDNKELERLQHDLLTTETVQREGEAERMRELDKLREIMDRLEKENKDQSDEIINLQKRLMSGSGGEEMLEELQEQLKNSREQNDNLQALCQELEDTIEKTSSEDIGKQKGGRKRTVDSPKKVREITKLRKNVGVLEKEKKNTEGMGTEAILEQLQERLEDSEGKVKALEIKCSNLDKARNDSMKQNKDLLKTRDKARRSYDNVKNKRRPSESVVDKKGTKTPPRKIKESTVLSPERRGEQYASMSGDGDKEESSLVEISSKGDTEQTGSEQLPVFLPSYDDCIEMIPKITEERDHWKEKYKSLRKKVGEQFVDIIPEVRAEEAKLEKERNDMLSHVLELTKEIATKESPLLETMAENERVERKLRKVEGQLEDNTEQLEYIRDLEDQEERIKEEQSKLRQCLIDLESMSADNDDLQEKAIVKGDGDNNEEIYSDKEESREGLHGLYEEVKNLSADTANKNVEHKQKHQNGSQEAKIQKEILNLEKAIEELLQGSSAGASKPSRSASRSLGNSGDSEKYSVPSDELERISREVSELQLSLEASSLSNSREVSNLVGLIKEKSRVEDELSEANKALDKLGKRDLDNLVKERAKHEKVAKRLMELSREKEGFDNEFQKMEASVKAKEAELLSYFKSEKENEKQVSKRKSGSVEEEMVEEKYSEGVLSEEETLEGSAEKQPQLSREDAILMSEELGSMIQKKSSLAVRLDSLGKEITAQSLKVEKSLVGVKEDPGGELNPGSSQLSLDDLSQSQLSIFDDNNMVDELSLATGVVREERVKRKLSRTTPMSKLLKEKAGLDKKHKELQVKIVVQNTKFRNALREAKDTDQAQGKFVRFIEAREQIENELATVVSKMDECKNLGDESASKGKLGNKRRASSGSLGIRRKSQDKTGGKSLNKNDKRNLLSQRESLVKKLDDVKRRIEDFCLEVDGDDIEVFPEMAEVGNVGKTVEKLRELTIREAELNQNLEGVTKNAEQSDEDKLNEGVVSYRGVMDVLRKEKENKEDMLAKLEIDVERVERINGVGKDDKDLQKKMKVLKGKIENAHRELEIEKQNLKEEFLDISEGKEVLKNNITGLTKQKEQLEKELVELQESLQMDTAKSGQDAEQVRKDYEQFARLKKKEESSGEALEEINRKLLTRKQWATFDDEEQTPEGQGEDNRNNLAQSYGDILKMMDDENLNMADLIRELEVTQETLSREREITGELLDLIKSRVGIELLEALTGDGLLSPLLETAEMNTAGSGEYQEVANKIEHDSVTVAEIITDYKKMNELAQKENQKMFEILGLLKSKIDEDLFAAIIDEEPNDLEDSKKLYVSKILENNETLFQQIVTGENRDESHEKRVKFLNEKNEKLKMELDDAKDVNEENKRTKDELEYLKKEVRIITAKLEDVMEIQKEEQLERRNEDLKELEKECASSKEMLANLEKENEAISVKFEDARNKQEETKSELKYMKEEKYRLVKETEQRIIVLTFKLDETERTKKEMVVELKNLQEVKESFEVKVLKQSQVESQYHQSRSEINVVEEKLTLLKKENYELLSKLEETDKMNEGMRNELKLNEQIGEENKLMKEKMNVLRKQIEEVVCELNKEKETNKEILEELKCLGDLKEENVSMKEKMAMLRKQNEEVVCELNKEKETNKEILEELKCLGDLKEENVSMKEKMAMLRKQNEEVVCELNKEKETNKEIAKESGDLKQENVSIKEKMAMLRKQNEEVVCELNKEKETNKEILEELKCLGDLKEENVSMKEKMDMLRKQNEEVVCELNREKNTNKEIAKELGDLKQENVSIKEKMDMLRKQNEEVVRDLNKEKETNKEILEELKCLGDLKEENISMKETMDMLQKQNEDLVCDLNREKDRNKEIAKELGDLKQENVSIKEMLEVLEKENNEIIHSLEDLKRINKALEDEVEYLRKEKEDLESLRIAWNMMEQNEVRLKQELEGLKNEKYQLDDYIAKLLERDISGGLEKALEDYNKEFKDAKEEQKSLARECESLKELQQIIGPTLAEKLLSLSKEQVVEDTSYIPRSLKSISTSRITLGKVLENYEKDLDTIEKGLGKELFGYVLDKDQASGKTKEEKPLKMFSEFKESGKDLTQIVKAYEDLIDAQASEIKLSEGLSQKVETLETELASLRKEKYELGNGLDGSCSDDNADVGVSTSAEEMKVENELVNKNDDMKHLVNAEHVSEKSKQDGLKGRGENSSGGEEERGLGGNNEDEGRLFEHHDLEPLDMESEYQELLRKVIEHQQEIQQAEEMLQEQRKQHEVEKQQLVGHLNNEKNSMLYQVECERNSMEKAMQNLINEIVRLKEERKEIRKNNRMEREKMEMAFEKERIELYSKNEMAKTDTKERLEKTFLELSQKEKGMMEEKENELKEELLKLKNERKEMVVKLIEMEHELNDGRLSEEKNSDHFQDMREKEEEERREQIRNEFEEKLRKEKKTFQETLVSLRQEIDTLQQQRSKALGYISKNDTLASNAVEATDYTISRQGIYERIESEFKAKIHSEKTSLENRIKELRREKEELHEQKREMKASMRSQRFEMSKKYEKEKEELAEKYRNEMKELRNKLHEKSEQNRTEANAIAKSFSDYQNFYELQRSLREKEAKIRRYEAFFKELNQEASIFQQDPNITKLV